MRKCLFMTAPIHLLDDLVAWGLTDVVAECPDCASEFDIPIKALGVPGDTVLAMVPFKRTLACPQCSAPSRIKLPDAKRFKIAEPQKASV